MTRYEELILLSPELGVEECREIVNNFSAIVEREGGSVIKIDDWGVKDTAYPVRKFSRGRYIRMELDLPGSAVTELERNVRITDGVFKFITVRLAETPEAATEEA
ncbi:MAG: 30S ribosomal protein S6 [Desulfomicrobium sp.]|nr:30S ribosomal protein S6 [Pseudomonadota bacterium]MBV1710538.1 30S ribosomal protein S6 [Desulfomicrobium sp.]MBU4570146.1 30S ribosomal protein S6 [Pseudomonadota bacterium]MBU4593066.1 30S ribosomal protein S6 [Pseudomonadota bacterium]MBV1718875.1 30S ribosomal protein S6 [Desulfomicrobium sp.]